MSKPSHTLKNLEKIKDFFGVTEDVLKKQATDILEKMLDAAHADDFNTLHQLGYCLFTTNSVS